MVPLESVGIQFQAQEASMNSLRMLAPLGHFWKRHLLENFMCFTKKLDKTEARLEHTT
jgi:hypothetical protein